MKYIDIHIYVYNIHKIRNKYSINFIFSFMIKDYYICF